MSSVTVGGVRSSATSVKKLGSRATCTRHPVGASLPPARHRIDTSTGPSTKRTPAGRASHTGTAGSARTLAGAVALGVVASENPSGTVTVCRRVRSRELPRYTASVVRRCASTDTAASPAPSVTRPTGVWIGIAAPPGRPAIVPRNARNPPDTRVVSRAVAVRCTRPLVSPRITTRVFS